MPSLRRLMIPLRSERTEICKDSRKAMKYIVRPSTRSYNEMQRIGERAAQKQNIGGPRPQMLPCGTKVTACYWGIGKAQLQELYGAAKADARWCDTDSIPSFVEKFVKPETSEKWMGLSLFRNQHAPRIVTLMVSHCWKENAGRFFEDVLEYMYDTDNAFIFFLAIYQGSEQDITEQLGENIYKAPFSDILKSRECRGLLVVANEELKENGEGLYSRLWCDWEINVAAQVGLPIVFNKRVTEFTYKEYLFGSGNASSRDAKCGFKNDQKIIRHAIEEHPPPTKKQMGAQAITLVFSVSIAWTTYKICVPNDSFGKGIAQAVGFFVGLLLMSLAGHSGPFLAKNYRQDSPADGYKALDDIIIGAALGGYETRRFNVASHVSVAAGIGLLGCVVGFIVKVLVQLGIPIPCGLFYLHPQESRELVHSAWSLIPSVESNILGLHFTTHRVIESNILGLNFGLICATCAVLWRAPVWKSKRMLLLTRSASVALFCATVVFGDHLGALLAETRLGQYFAFNSLDAAIALLSLPCHLIFVLFAPNIGCSRMLSIFGYLVGAYLALLNDNFCRGLDFIYGGLFGLIMMMVLTFPDWSHFQREVLHMIVITHFGLFFFANVRTGCFQIRLSS